MIAVERATLPALSVEGPKVELPKTSRVFVGLDAPAQIEDPSPIPTYPVPLILKSSLLVVADVAA